MRKIVLAHLAVLTANIIYGINFSIAKDVMPAFIGPFAFILIRVVSAAILFLIIHLFFIKQKVARKHLFLLMQCALFGVAINQLLFFKGLSLTQPINAALVMCTNPIQVVLLSAMLGKEKMGWHKWAGIIMGLTGAISIILFGKKYSLNNQTFLGDAMVFTNALAYAYFMIIAKPLLKEYHPLTVMKYSFLIGSIMVLPFGLPEFLEINWQQMPQNIYPKIAFVVIGTTFIAYIFNSFGLRYLSSSVVSVYIYAQPVFATLMSMYKLQGNPGWLHGLAALLIFSGIYLASRSDGFLKKETG
ncbi:MAG: EamA family transporter [Bacteroidia bacterium]|nr:EamA family transporter [Bacteroidia bacterium]